MFKNYFKIAMRQLRKQCMYSMVKICGFALGIAACLLIALYTRVELNYDKSYPDTSRIFRITGEYDSNGKLETGEVWPPPMAKALKADYPEVEKSGRLMPHELLGANAAGITTMLSKDFAKPGPYRHTDCFAYRMLGDAQMAGRFRLLGTYQLVDVCACGFRFYFNSLIHGQFSGRQSGPVKPGK